MRSVLLVTKEAVYASKGYPFKNISYIINVLNELMVSNFIIDIFIIYIIQDNAFIDLLWLKLPCYWISQGSSVFKHLQIFSFFKKLINQIWQSKDLKSHQFVWWCVFYYMY